MAIIFVPSVRLQPIFLKLSAMAPKSTEAYTRSCFFIAVLRRVIISALFLSWQISGEEIFFCRLYIIFKNYK